MAKRGHHPDGGTGHGDSGNGESQVVANELISSGVHGLDTVLGGGLRARRLYLLRGDPGAGKSTLAMQFLLHGAERGETGLYITLSENRTELEDAATSHGWSLESVQVLDSEAVSKLRKTNGQQTVFHSSELELGDMMGVLMGEIDRLRPSRVVVDSISEIRLLSSGPLRYWRQVHDLKRFMAARGITSVLVTEQASCAGELDLQGLAHGVISLEQRSPEHGAERRRLRVAKVRGQDYLGGYHDMAIRTGGVDVFPRIVTSGLRDPDEMLSISSGVPALDKLLGGGLELGTSALMLGPSGVGKSTIAVQHAFAAAERGETACIFLFDESVASLRQRSSGLGMDLRPHIESGRLIVRKIDTTELSPGEFFGLAKRMATEELAKVIVIDSLNGYMQSMSNEKDLLVRLHEVLADLGSRGVLTIVVAAEHGLVGDTLCSSVDVSYLADSVVLLRYFESFGQVRRAVSVIKKRTGDHETTIRELRMSREGIWVGEPLARFRGLLTGTPEYLPKDYFQGLEESGDDNA